jgi:hypothetical protein
MLENNKIKLSLVCVGILALGVGIGRFSKPSEVVTEIKEKEVIKYVESKEEKKNIKTTKKKVVNADGSSIETETTEDNSSTSSTVSSSSTRESEFKQKTKNTTGLTLSTLVLARDLNVNEFEYGVAVSKRVLGNVSVGVVVTDKRAVGLTVGLEF